jgi:hypothetical protein
MVDLKFALIFFFVFCLEERVRGRRLWKLKLTDSHIRNAFRLEKLSEKGIEAITFAIFYTTGCDITARFAKLRWQANAYLRWGLNALNYRSRPNQNQLSFR